MERPAFTRLLRHVRTGEVQQIAVWRLDRLERVTSTHAADDEPNGPAGVVNLMSSQACFLAMRSIDGIRSIRQIWQQIFRRRS